MGLVVVSHSRRLAEAAVELALQMVHGEQPPIRIAAGMPDGGLGTDAMEVMAAIQEVSAGAGVVVLVDLGSAVMSAEMACEFLDDEAADVRILAAPFVEGLLAAAVLAAGGATLDEVAREATAALSPKIQALPGGDEEPEPAPQAPADDWGAEAADEASLPNKMGLHARPASLFASTAASFDAEVRVLHERGTVAARSPLALATLAAKYGETLRVEARGPEASEAVAALLEMVRDGFGEAGPEEPVQQQEPAASPSNAAASRSPLGVSPGRVVGPSRRMLPALAEEPPSRQVPRDGVAQECERLEQAVAAVVAEYRRRSSTAQDEAAEILSATAGLAEDATLLAAARRRVEEERLGAPNAFWQAADEVAATMRAAGGLLAERATDITDIRDRVVSHLLGVPMPGIPDPGHPFILVARDLAPSDTSALDPATCLGIVTVEGGPTSHTAILARSMGIPAVAGVVDALDIADDTRVLIDGGSGQVIISPADDELDGARTKPAELVPLAEPGRTSDGFEVPLLANVGSGKDARGAALAAAEGIGLFRTEFAFLDRADEPGVEEQVAQYRAVLNAFPGRRVVIRTLDAGSDKPMPFLTIPGEPNPALGIRGYRTAVDNPEVLARQLAAIVRASEDSEADVWVMAPMISTVDEAAAFARLAREAGVRKVGVMVETPSAALQTADLLEHVDFVSVGTNDLTQYTMAADRQATSLGELQDPWQPGVLRLLREVGRAATEAGKSAGICGEAASDPLLASVLVGLGITSLSMGPRALHSVGATLAAASLEQCRRAADAACAAPTAAAAKQAVADVLGGGRAAA
ncbi:phosphoenolpyruvate--protein phosphotransferase [Tessaracoccus rhinocerotis]|uniref:phosphoenolpyruvate--protein phosphotransferase n=1 Tax=Tessaracoccus rhinocerotis TaxID=1689449 RepID=UPI00163DD1E4|nr:phosphoenolpyruvate--protein phosphotransferase [Tessaracoccus rhinocerotis]